nr:hypothetical protein [uncultured Rhodopila sp.]
MSNRAAPPVRGYSPAASRTRIIVYWVLIIFIVIFPKSGVKSGVVPLTTGYALVCLAAPLAMADNLLRSRSSIASFMALAMCAPFGGVVALSLWINGAVTPGAGLAAVASFILLPPVFFGLFASQLAMIPWPVIRRSIIISMRVVAVYGLFLFALKLLTGSFLEIPYLTVNADDAGMLESTKHIDRGGIFKLISTYNNGNLFGASMLLLLPLYIWMERSRVFIGIFIAAMILTLSRSVWLGLLATCAMMTLQSKVTARMLVVSACGLALFVVAIWFIAGYVGNGSNFLIDPTMGGRNSTLDQMTQIGLMPDTPVDMLPEIVYAGVIVQYGVLGLLAFCAYLFGPIVVAKIRFPKLLPVQRYAATGILGYAAICLADGGIMLIPVIPIFLFVSIILLEAPRLMNAGNRIGSPMTTVPGEIFAGVK